MPRLFVGGHEHSLQLHRNFLGVYYLVSGAGSASKVDRVIDEMDMDTLMKAAAKPGYMRLDQHADFVLDALWQLMVGSSECYLGTGSGIAV